MKRIFLDYHSLRNAFPFAAACFTVGLTLFACADKDVETNDNNGKALVAFNVSETQDQAQAAAKANQPMTRAAFAHQLALQDLAPEDLTMQKLPVQGAAASSDICLIETTVPGLPSQWEDNAPTRANITTMPTMQNFSTTAFYGYSDTSLVPWFYDKDTKKDGTLVTPIYWDWVKTHACFYAVYPKPDNNKLKLSPDGYTSTPYVDFEVEPNVKNQKDLMTACSGPVHSTVTNISAVETQATAPRTDLTFRHALTAVRFKVGQNLSWNKTITKVEIVGAKSKGRYILPTDKTVTGSWDATSLSTPATFTLGGDGTVNVSTSEAINNIIMGNSGDNFVFYMIPQSLAGVQVKVYFDNIPTPAITANLAGTWKAGTTKTYALSQNTSNWQYELTIVSPATLHSDYSVTGNYTIQSYRKDLSTNTLQKVPWKVLGYSTDNGLTWSDEKPEWLIGLTKDNGEGSVTGETGQGNVQGEPYISEALDLDRHNAILKLHPKGSISSYYDLSTHDIKGNSTSRNTANCYVISHPGYYKIPLVYGNAIKNGAPNTNAYISSITGTNILEHFKDHNDQNITNPWITLSNGGVNAPDGAKLVWAEEVGVVTNLSVVGSGTNAFVQFEVPASTITNTNAIIAVTKGNTVVWSWHLWFIQEDALDPITCTNFQGKKYTFSKETLGMFYNRWRGASYTTPRSIKIKVVQNYGQGSPITPKEGVITIMQTPRLGERSGRGTYYQFGRKDPLPVRPSVMEGNYRFDNTLGGHSLGYAIQHPGIMFHNAEGGGTNYSDWCNATYQNLWSANNATLGYSNNTAVVKTVYDPCPVGFKMPAPDAFTGFTKTGVGAYPADINAAGLWYRGWNFNNKLISPDAAVYFPAAGERYLTTGMLFQIDTSGYYWSATPQNMAAGCGMLFQSGYVDPMYGPIYGGRGMGYSIHPVVDD